MNGRVGELSTWVDWAILLLGVVLILTPFAFGMSQDPTAEWSDIAIGGLLIVLSLLKLFAPGRTQT